MTDETNTLITDMLSALRAYELDVDESPPHSHRELVERAERWVECRRMNKDEDRIYKMFVWISCQLAFIIALIFWTLFIRL